MIAVARKSFLKQPTLKFAYNMNNLCISFIAFDLAIPFKFETIRYVIKLKNLLPLPVYESQNFTYFLFNPQMCLLFQVGVIWFIYW